MNKTARIVLKESVVFALLLSVFWVTTSALLIHFTEGMEQMRKIRFYINWSWLETFIQIGVSFWLLMRISARLPELKYWTLVIGMSVLVLISYHTNFLANSIYFYATHTNYQPEGKEGLEGLLQLFTGRNEAPPVYDPVHALFAFFINLRHIGSLSVWYVLYGLVLDWIALSFWLSACVWYFRKKRNLKNVPINPNELIDL